MEQLELEFTKPSKFKTKPYAHQLECLNKFGRREEFALLAEMGTGKTWIIINNMADLWASGDCTDVLVFAPNGVHSNWTRLELPKHMPDWVEYQAAAWNAQGRKKEKEDFKTAQICPPTTLRILTMNWEALQTKRGFGQASVFCFSANKLMIVCDESDAVKNPAALRTKNLMKLKTHSKYRRIMTGTPITNSPFDAFSQFSFLDDNILGTTSYYAFKAEYAEMLHEGNPLLDHIRSRTGSKRAPQVVARGAGGRPKYRNLDKLSKHIAPHSFRVLKEDCLDLPEKIYKTLLFDMTKEQTEVYNKVRDECRLVFKNKETPFNKLVALQKLAQVTSGYYLHPLANKPVRIEGKNPKLDLLVDRVKAILEMDEKVIIWARYRAEIDDIGDALGKLPVVRYQGGMKKDDRQWSIDCFESGDAQVFLSNQQAGGQGITLVAASYVIYFSNNFSLRDRLQSEDRAHRIGQKKNVTYINIAAKGTIDEHVIKALESKKDVSDAIINNFE